MLGSFKFIVLLATKVDPLPYHGRAMGAGKEFVVLNPMSINLKGNLNRFFSLFAIL